MAFALLGVRLLLAIVFGAAALGKIRDRDGFAKALTGFGFTGLPAAVAATLVPALELATAGLLLPAAAAGWGAIASIALLVGFTVIAAASLLRGNAPDCACFGAIGTEPVGSMTVARNTVLMALSAFVLLAGPGAAWTAVPAAWTEASADERVLGSVLLVSLVALAALSLHASRLRGSQARMQADAVLFRQQLRSEQSAVTEIGNAGLPPGTRAPDFSLPRLEGDRASLTALTSHDQPLVLIFLSSHCSACHELWPDIERWQARTADRVVVACVCSGSDQTIEVKVMGYAVSNVLLEGDAGVGEAYRIALRPSAVIVRNGVIDSRSVVGTDAIRALVASRTRAADDL